MHCTLASLLSALVVCSLACSGAAAIPRFVEVPVEAGTVRGLDDGSVARFLGIPFAAPPRQDLRWAPPQPAQSFAGVLDCSQYRAGCMQKPQELFEITHMSEDCLFLNVFAPSLLNAEQPGVFSELKPVMVFIHGGAFTYGAGVEIKYNGTLMTQRHDVVFVSLNYRLGSFGFLAQEAFLNEDGENPTAGLYGIQDQQMALQWVQDNIAQFGGDPSRVTIFGESAGGMSICIHLAMPSSQNLFQSAIIESGICSGYQTLDKALPRGDQYASDLGCDPSTFSDASDLRDCMRGKTPAEALLHQGEFPAVGPVVDGYFLTQQPSAAIKAGEANRVPLMIGTNQDEGRLFIGLKWGLNITSQEYLNILQDILGPLPASVIYSMYSPRKYGSAINAFNNLVTDMIFNCPSQETAKASQKYAPTYVYEFEHEPSWSPGAGAYHGSEIPFVFGYPHAEGAEFTEDEETLSEQMQSYWTAFATSGDPGADWPAYTADGVQILGLQTGEVEVLPGYREEMCRFWDTTYDLIRNAMGGDGDGDGDGEGMFSSFFAVSAQRPRRL